MVLYSLQKNNNLCLARLLIFLSFFFNYLLNCSFLVQNPYTKVHKKAITFLIDRSIYKLSEGQCLGTVKKSF